MAETSGRTFDIGAPLPEEYKELLVRMLAHEGERTSDRSFMEFLATLEAGSA